MWLLSNVINERGFHVDRKFAEGCRSWPIDAVRCAVEVQRGMAEQNATVPQVKRISANSSLGKLCKCLGIGRANSARENSVSGRLK